jgi:predicted SAM-dependent methyltransferase
MNAKRAFLRCRRMYRSATAPYKRFRAGRALGRKVAASPEPIRVHLGCGPVYLDGWLNLDIERGSRADIRVDLRFGLPLPGESTSYVFSEHVFEHLELLDGKQLLRDICRSLAPSGVLRIAMPDLASLVERYENDWHDQEWLKDPYYDKIDTAANMLNVALRSWGHLYVYDFDDLRLRLDEAGFSKIERVEWGASEHDELRGLERRPDSILIVEAVR